MLAAEYSADRHVLSGCREMTIMLKYVGQPPKRGYYHHRCSKWIRLSRANFDWAIDHALALCREYTYRYGKIHANQQVIEEIASQEFEFPYEEMTKFALAVADDCLDRRVGAIDAYRDYYVTHKNHLLTYTRREVPYWLKEMGLGTQKEAKCLAD